MVADIRGLRQQAARIPGGRQTRHADDRHAADVGRLTSLTQGNLLLDPEDPVGQAVFPVETYLTAVEAICYMEAIIHLEAGSSRDGDASVGNGHSDDIDERFVDV